MATSILMYELNPFGTGGQLVSKDVKNISDVENFIHNSAEEIFFSNLVFVSYLFYVSSLFLCLTDINCDKKYCRYYSHKRNIRKPSLCDVNVKVHGKMKYILKILVW